ncbi:MAG: hypothetical protein M3N14_12145, partial [Bacteroidota bacterium]|nr:hypothetical protein [Bacteroidota bacterium]
VQPQWTFVLFAPLVMLALVHFKQTGGAPRWLFKLGVVNLALILSVRIIIIFGFGFARTYGHLKSYYGFKDWAHAVKQRAGNNYVVMNEGFQNPSKYDYYTNSLTGFAYDPWYYRRTQFDIWPMEDSIRRKRVYYLFYKPVSGYKNDTIKVAAGTWYGCWIDDLRTYQKVNFETSQNKVVASPGQKIVFDLTVSNPYHYPITFTNKGYLHPVLLDAIFFTGDKTNVQQASGTFNQISLKPGETTHYKFTIIAPREKGDTELLFSLRTEPFPGSKNSKMINFTVK